MALVLRGGAASCMEGFMGRHSEGRLGEKGIISE